MIDDSIYRIYTQHRSQMFLDRGGRLIHRRLDVVSSNVFPVYARRMDDGLALFVIKDNRIEYLSPFVADNAPSDNPIVFERLDNADGSISIRHDGKYLSARRDSGLFDLRENSLEWEHFTLDRAEFKLTDEFFPPSIFPSIEKTIRRAPSKETSPKVSVVIPMYNAAAYIDECLDSVLKQTLKDYEVIVVDDRSIDNSVEVVEGMMPKFDGRLKLIRLRKNSGNPGTPRNVGLNAAIGKYVFFLDSDDLLLENALQLLYEIAEKHHADLLDNGKYYFFWRREDKIESKLVANQVIREQRLDPCDTESHVRDFYSRRYWITPWCKFLRRDFLVENRIAFPATYAIEDATFSFQCIVCAKIFVRIPDVFYMYNIRTGSITKTRRSVEEHISRFVSTISAVFKMIGGFMDRTAFFAAHPESRYIAIKHFFEYHINGGVAGLARQYENNSLPRINDITYRVMSEGVNFTDELIAIVLVNATGDRLEQIAERDRRIKELRAELENLNTAQIKNPAE